LQAEQRLPSGTQPGARLHHFWTCPVAAAVATAVGTAAGVLATRDSLWLAICPPHLCTQVWDVVSLAALGAMEHGRRYMAAGGMVHGSVATLRLRAEAAAVAAFWGSLSGFVALGKAPRSWGDVPPNHPLVGRAASGLLVLNRPGG
jgi:hypothetical protein